MRFRFIKAPKDEEDVEEKERQAVLKRNKAEEAAFGTYASQGGAQFTYRVKKESAFGGYKIVTENTQGSLSREELLDKRMKKKSDRQVRFVTIISTISFDNFYRFCY